MKTRKLLITLIIVLFVFQAYSATFIVNNTADVGVGTLRQAILDANAAAGADIINFNFGVPVTITLASAITVTGPITIDGYSDPGASAGNLMIEIISSGNGIDLGPGSNGSIVRGLVISGGINCITLRNSDNHIISGNYLGTNRAGTAVAAARPQNCINYSTSNNSTIGGTGGQIDRNIISGATQDGIRMASSTGAIIINNYIGTDVTGNIAIANSNHGIEAYSNSDNIRVGGTTTDEMNVISGNIQKGVFVNNSRSPVIKGNIIGMGVDGTTKLGNGQAGIHIENSGTGAPQIGGITLGERNYISCNGAFGIQLLNCNNSVIEGNWVGVDKATGNLDYGNFDAGLEVKNSADVRVGGSVAGSGNIFSGNGNPGPGADGISIWSTSPRPIIKGNIIGLGADGVTSIQNYGHGIECLTCIDGIIGGPTLLERNYIASSYLMGIQLVNSSGMDIINNYLGTDVSGTLDRGGTSIGINVSNSSDVMIGGSSANANIIAFNNASAGIIVDNGSQRNTITFNKIFCNVGPGIDLLAAANESVPAPVISSSTSNSVTGTGTDGNIVHVYNNITSDGGIKCNCEGEIYIGSTTVSGGVWTLTHSLDLTSAASVSATQTTPLGSTSEFSTCSSPLPIELISFDVLKGDGHEAIITWATAMELNNNRFEIQHSVDGNEFMTIEIVPGESYSNIIRNYSVRDMRMGQGVNYYRVKQVDFDGKFSFSNIKSLTLGDNYGIKIFSRHDGAEIVVYGNAEKSISYNVFSVTGQKVACGELIVSPGIKKIPLKLDMPSGVYIINVIDEHIKVQEKLLIVN